MSSKSVSPSRHLPASGRGTSRHLYAIGVAGVAAGVLIGGIGGRLVMRGATLVSSIRGAKTEAEAIVGEFTLEGTIALVIFLGIFSGLTGAVIFAVTRPWLMWAGTWHGALFGIFLFFLASATSDVLNTDNLDFRLLDNNHLIVLMFFALFVLFGTTIAGLFSWMDRRLPSFENAGPLLRIGYVGASVFGPLLAIALLPPLVFTRNFCDCDPPLTAGIAFIVLVLVTLAIWIIRSPERKPRTLHALRLSGWTALGVAAVAGALRAISDVSEILSL